VTRPRPAAIAIAAHPDDIEFVMAGTLVLLKRAGYETHYFNLLSGNGGSSVFSAARTRHVRRAEAKTAAALLGAIWHAPIGDDLELTYSVPALRRVAAVIRDVRASIVLTHSPLDYMEDHMTACRLALTGAFAHGIKNFVTTPRRASYQDDVTVYHAMPHGLCDGLRQAVTPGAFVNTTAVHDVKFSALAAHRSQHEWLRVSQGMNSYLQSMVDTSRALGTMSSRFRLAEGWRRHLHYGYSRAEVDPLKTALGRDYLVNRRYERALAEREC
jgi:LmbE family N-acetylglucosaminyl deacetylase